MNSTVNRLSRFKDWIVLAAPGQKFVYHNGNLAFDRAQLRAMEDENGKVTVTWAYVPEVHAVGSLAMRAQLAGFVELVQRRTDPDACEYIAVRTHKPYGGK